MPKIKDKKKVSESESSDDDSSEEEKPAPSKKAKTTPAKDENGDYSWHLEKMKYVKVREFKGKVYVDIREYYETDGKLKPGKKGISVTVDQWRRVKDLIPEIDDAIKEM